MSVCIVATYPWGEIRSEASGEPPGAIVCSDTRLTRLARPPAPMTGAYAKQYLVGPTLHVCFTSSNVTATEAALRHRKAVRGLDVLGERLRSAHAERGGLTQLLAVTFKGPGAPRAYSLTPPDYAPVRRFGVIGIGARRVLEWFRENREPVPREAAEISVLREQMRTANPDISFYDAPRHDLDSAAVRLVATLQEAILRVEDPTVGLPLHAATFAGGIARELTVAMSEGDLTRWKRVAVARRESRRVQLAMHRVPNDDRALPPLQLIE